MTLTLEETRARAEISDFDRAVRLIQKVDNANNTLTINFGDILNYSRDLYTNLVANPVRYVTALEQHIQNTTGKRVQVLFTGDVVGDHNVIPRQLHSDQLRQLYKISGIVTKLTAPVPSIQSLVVYNQKDKNFSEQEFQDPFLTLQQNQQGANRFMPREFSNIESQNDLIREYGLSNFQTCQRLILQDCPEHIPNAQLPASINVNLSGALVDVCKSGDRVDLIGVLLPAPTYSQQANSTTQFFLLAMGVKTLGRSQFQLPIDKEIYQKAISDFLLQSQKASSRLLNKTQSSLALQILQHSIAPSICGHNLIKKAIALQLLSGVRRVRNSMAVRGDINILLIGSPGCGKSQLLRAAMKMLPVSVSSSGRGASGAGLTAAVTIDNQTGVRQLEAGAMVLADSGIICIDEFDKLQIYDRAAIHEAMEQQTISISKAGIHAQLNARCSVLAAANFLYGEFDEDRTISDNINLPDSLLSRFDLVFLIQDNLDKDQLIARHVVNNHLSSLPLKEADEMYQYQQSAQLNQSQTQQASAKSKKQPTQQSVLFDQIDQSHFIQYNEQLHEGAYKSISEQFSQPDQQIRKEKFLLNPTFFKNLVVSCRQASEDEPRLSMNASDQIAQCYADLRQLGQSKNAYLPVTARSLESLIRLSTAIAKLSIPLREVAVEDVLEAYVLVRHSLFGEGEREIQRYIAQKADWKTKVEAQKKKQTARVATDQDQQIRNSLLLQMLRSFVLTEVFENQFTVIDLARFAKKWCNDMGVTLFKAPEIQQLLPQVIEEVEGAYFDKDIIYV